MHFVSDTAPIISCLFRFEKSEGSNDAVVVFSGVQALTFQAPYEIRLEEVADPMLNRLRIRPTQLGLELTAPTLLDVGHPPLPAQPCHPPRARHDLAATTT